jgi:hypothetical protein
VLKVLLICLVTLLAFAAALIVAVCSLPISVFFLIVLLGWWLTRKSQGITKKAVHGRPHPPDGMGGVTLLLTVFNLVPAANNSHVVSKVQEHLLTFDEFLERWTKLSTGNSLAALCLLAAISCWLPKWRLVSRWLQWNGWAGQVVAVMAVVTSFTFTTSALSAYDLAKAHIAITAQYQRAEDRKGADARRYVAAETLRIASLGLAIDVEHDYSALFRATAASWQSLVDKKPLLAAMEYTYQGSTVDDAVAADYGRADAQDVMRPNPPVSPSQPVTTASPPKIDTP